MSTTSSFECRICAVASGRYALGGADRPWLENERYLALTSIGPLVEGWTLAVPRTHSLNLLNDYTDASFVRFVRNALSVIEAAYGSAVVFEHGAQCEGSATSCGTSHAHLHIVPLKFSLQREAVRFDRSLKWFRCSLNSIKERVGHQEYLFVADRYEGAETTGEVCVLQSGQSQFFRRVIAERLGLTGQSDYKTHPNLATAEVGSNNLSLLSRRLKAA